MTVETKVNACGRSDCMVSSSIASYGDDIEYTFGRGKLDENGYWEFPCCPCARAYEAENPEVGTCWPAPIRIAIKHEECRAAYSDHKTREEHPARITLVTWSRIFISRQEAFTIRLRQELDEQELPDYEYRNGQYAHEHRQWRHWQVVEISPTALYDPAIDYIVEEIHTKGKHASNREQVHCRCVLPGYENEPDWMTSQRRWQDWVLNKQVRASAAEFIAQAVPSAAAAVRSAVNWDERGYIDGQLLQRRTERVAEWRTVAAECNKAFANSVDIARLPDNDKATITAINTMPITIATNLSFNQTIGKRWYPPQPRPKRIHPDKSGRILVDIDSLPTV